MRNGAYRIVGQAKSITGEIIDLDGEYNVVVRDHTRGLYADVARRIVGSVTVDEKYRNAVADALKAHFPPLVEPFQSDHCVHVGELIKIAEPIEYQIYASSIAGPYVRNDILHFIVNYCVEHLGAYGFDRIYLIGSQATGISSKTGKPVSARSDHDFVAVIGDDAPDDMNFGCEGFSEFYNKMNATRGRLGLGFIDIFVKTASVFEEGKGIDGSVYHKAMQGKLLAQRA